LGLQPCWPIEKRKKEIEERLRNLEEEEELGSLSSDLIRLRNSLRIELMQMLDEEEVHWFRRCNETWFLKGDNSTKFFHRTTNGRKRKQMIFSLQDEGITITRTENLLKHAIDYYRKLFGLADGNAFELSNDLWPEEETVRRELNEELVKPFSEEEVDAALLEMERNKAVGPDGIPIEFYQTF
jgi:hypothetical protein